MRGRVVVAGGSFQQRLLLEQYLFECGYGVIKCSTSAELGDAAEAPGTIAVLMLHPDDSGAVKEFYSSRNKDGGRAAPIVSIALSRVDNDLARAAGYGADEFLIEPVSLSELEVVISRVVGERAGAALVHGDLKVDNRMQMVSLRGQAISIDPVGARILAFLMGKPGHAFTRSEISLAVWGANSSVDDRTIDVCIGRIRDALKHRVAVDPIRTVRNVGYSLNEEFATTQSRPKKGRVMRPGA